MFTRKQGARAKYQESQGRRVKNALTLRKRFPRLKSLTVNLCYFDSDTPTNSHPLKFSVNIQHAKSVLLFHCPNTECIRGDFDLTGELARRLDEIIQRGIVGSKPEAVRQAEMLMVINF